MANLSADPEAVVQRQLEAYNARDIDALLATYADDAEIFEHPSRLLARGAEELRSRYSGRFQEPNLHATLNHRLVMGSTVIDHESIRRRFPEGTGTLEAIMIYEVRDGRIAKAWTIVGAKVLDA